MRQGCARGMRPEDAPGGCARGVKRAQPRATEPAEPQGGGSGRGESVGMTSPRPGRGGRSLVDRGQVPGGAAAPIIGDQFVFQLLPFAKPGKAGGIHGRDVDEDIL